MLARVLPPTRSISPDQGMNGRTGSNAGSLESAGAANSTRPESAPQSPRADLSTAAWSMTWPSAEATAVRVLRLYMTNASTQLVANGTWPATPISRPWAAYTPASRNMSRVANK